MSHQDEYKDQKQIYPLVDSRQTYASLENLAEKISDIYWRDEIFADLGKEANAANLPEEEILRISGRLSGDFLDLAAMESAAQEFERVSARAQRPDRANFERLTAQMLQDLEFNKQKFQGTRLDRMTCCCVRGLVAIHNFVTAKRIAFDIKDDFWTAKAQTVIFSGTRQEEDGQVACRLIGKVAFSQWKQQLIVHDLIPALMRTDNVLSALNVIEHQMQDDFWEYQAWDAFDQFLDDSAGRRGILRISKGYKRYKKDEMLVREISDLKRKNLISQALEAVQRIENPSCRIVGIIPLCGKINLSLN